MTLPDTEAQYISPYANLLPPNARLLVQAGAHDGSLARHYRHMYPASSFMAVDADPSRAQQAREYADRVHQADLDQIGDTFYKHLEWADAWIFDGTLENLGDPLQVLKRVRKVIQYDACIVARVANPRHWNAPVEAPRHTLEVAAMLELFQGAGFRVVNGIMMNPGPVPQDVAAALARQAAQMGVAPEQLIEQVQPSHYLIKAMPA